MRLVPSRRGEKRAFSTCSAKIRCAARKLAAGLNGNVIDNDDIIRIRNKKRRFKYQLAR